MNIAINTVSNEQNYTMRNISSVKFPRVSFNGGVDTFQKVANKNKNKIGDALSTIPLLILSGLGALLSLFDKKAETLKTEISSLDVETNARYMIKSLDKDITEMLNKKSLSGECTDFVKDSIKFLADNVENDKLYPVHSVLGLQMNDEGKAFLRTIIKALDKTTSTKSIYNKDSMQNEVLNKDIEKARSFMENIKY